MQQKIPSWATMFTKVVQLAIQPWPAPDRCDADSSSLPDEVAPTEFTKSISGISMCQKQRAKTPSSWSKAKHVFHQKQSERCLNLQFNTVRPASRANNKYEKAKNVPYKWIDHTGLIIRSDIKIYLTLIWKFHHVVHMTWQPYQICRCPIRIWQTSEQQNQRQQTMANGLAPASPQRAL